ncbi:tetratricopeptide repeat protein [Candidatus Electrothrix sp.]|uniref:tetratricopeptide repeat protein n=2 Tax=Candidatus Electrothrix sp. TaxID=2170559 RepID=UPI00405773EB
MPAFERIMRISTQYLLGCLFLLITFSALPVFAQTADTHIKQGDIFYRQFDNVSALASYKRALEMQPGDFECLSKVVRAYNDIGEDLSSEESEQYYEQAVQYAERLQQMFPDRAKSYYQLAVSYGNLALLRGSKEKVKLSSSVEKNIRRALAMNPDYADAYAVLGIYYKEVASLNGFLKTFARLFFGDLPEGTYDDALKAFRKAIKLKTTRPVYTYFLIGRTYEEMDEPEKAKQAYLKAVGFPNTDHRDHAVKERARNRLRSL